MERPNHYPVPSDDPMGGSIFRNGDRWEFRSYGGGERRALDPQPAVTPRFSIGEHVLVKILTGQPARTVTLRREVLDVLLYPRGPEYVGVRYILKDTGHNIYVFEEYLTAARDAAAKLEGGE